MFSGVGTAIVTPFLKNDEVDYEALKNITRFQVENKVDAIVILGTTGEAPVISDEERYKIINTITGEVSGKCKIIIGTGGNNPKIVLALNKQAEQFSPDALLIVNPYYNKGTQESLVDYFSFISEQTVLPIILYNVPSRTGMNILPDTAIKIHLKNPNVFAIKEASGSISQIAHLCSIKPDSLIVYSGNDDQALPIMSLGAKGVISVYSNAYPIQMKNIIDNALNNDFSKAAEYQNKYLKMMNDIFVETSPAPIKYVMHKLGFCENILRLPLKPISEEHQDLLDKSMEKMK